jgi:PAS domain S-box-containing protein
VSGYLGTAIDITEHKRAETHLTLERSIARTLSETSCFEAAVTPILGLLCEQLGWDVGDLHTVGTEDRTPCWRKLWTSPSLDASALQAGSRARALPEHDGTSWQDGQPNWIADIALDEALARTPEAQQVGLHGMFRMPITVHGEVCAVLRLFCRIVRPKDEAVEELLTAIVAQFGRALEHQRSVALNRDSEALRAAILEAAPDAVISIDHQRRVVTFNAAAEEVFGYRREQVLGRELLGLVVPHRMREHVLALLENHLATGECGLPGRRLVALAMRSDGSELPVEVTMASSRAGPRSLLMIFVRDVTARENAERMAGHYQARLQTLVAERLVTEELERRRLAVELHDGLGRTFSLTRTRLSALRASMGGRFSPSLDEIDGLGEQASATALSLGFELSPPSLDDSGLEPAVHRLVESIESRCGLEIVLDTDALPKPADEQTRMIIFRSIRELLINAARHARAHHVSVLLEREGSRLKASIQDDGVGMQADAAILQGSGLSRIRELLDLVGGSMHIESVPGHGTKVRLCAPLASDALTET